MERWCRSVIDARSPRARPARFLTGRRYSAADAMGTTTGSAAGLSGSRMPRAAPPAPRDVVAHELLPSASGIAQEIAPAASTAEPAQFRPGREHVALFCEKSPSLEVIAASSFFGAERTPEGRLRPRESRCLRARAQDPRIRTGDTPWPWRGAIETRLRERSSRDHSQTHYRLVRLVPLLHQMIGYLVQLLAKRS
jgi:hypothetical protein